MHDILYNIETISLDVKKTLYKLIELCVGEIKGKVYFKFHKVHSQPANSALLTTKSACNKALFVGNKAQFPTCLSAG